jgi:hypothetical protein
VVGAALLRVTAFLGGRLTSQAPLAG